MAKLRRKVIAADLLAWYDDNRRKLPWRAPPGRRADPYRVWLSEIMLQQTTVTTVQPYFAAFLGRWPTIEALASAELDDVLHAWQGLGYYARARNLHKCARLIAAERRGRFPDDEAALRELPGIGPYTAAAIAAIAFGRRAVPVDGNVERVVARLFAVDEPLPAAKAKLRRLAESLAPARRPGDFAQAMMDLGQSICLPRRPHCARCPIARHCRANAGGLAESLPARTRKAAKPLRRGTAFWLVADDGAVLLRRRADQGLLGGMMEVPSTPWLETPLDGDDIGRHLPVRARGLRRLPGLVRHGFTHFDLELTVMTGRVVSKRAPAGGVWCPPGGLAGFALPTLMKKVCRHALSALNGHRAAAEGPRGRR